MLEMPFRPDVARKFRWLCDPITPLSFLAVQPTLILSFRELRPAQAWAGLRLLMLGIPTHISRARHRRAAHLAE